MIPAWDRRSEGCWESHRACNELARFEILSKGCSSQRVEFFLWKAVEKGRGVWETSRLMFPLTAKACPRSVEMTGEILHLLVKMLAYGK
jgi:hypothetical protein